MIGVGACVYVCVWGGGGGVEWVDDPSPLGDPSPVWTINCAQVNQMKIGLENDTVNILRDYFCGNYSDSSC